MFIMGRNRSEISCHGNFEQKNWFNSLIIVDGWKWIKSKELKKLFVVFSLNITACVVFYYWYKKSLGTTVIKL